MIYGTKRSTLAPGEKTEPKSNVSGNTPITVTEVLFRLIVFPTMLRSPASRHFQNG